MSGPNPSSIYHTAELPLWMRVAFAIRAAQRVSVLYLHKRSGYLQVDNAIRIAADIANGDRAGDTVAIAQDFANEANDAAVNAVDIGNIAAANAAGAAANAAYAAGHAALTTNIVGVVAADVAAEAAQYAIAAAAACDADESYGSVVSETKRDLARLLDYSRIHSVGDFPPVNFRELGPLWHDGEPEWFTQAERKQQEWLAEDADEDEEEVIQPSNAEVTGEGGPVVPRICVAYDPLTLSPDDYATLVKLVGDVAVASGATGLQRIDSNGFCLPYQVGEPV